MEQVSREHEAEMLRRRATMITRHVHLFGAAMGLEQQLGWMGVALASETLADALTLPETVSAAALRAS